MAAEKKTGWKNPLPQIVDDLMAKEVRLTFTFEHYVTKEDAVESLTKFFKETLEEKGAIPAEWIKLVDQTYVVDVNEL